MHAARIAIVGGGVSGLYAAWLLQQQGVTDWMLIEGREVLCGRILSLPASEQGVAANGQTTGRSDRFDLGPSWFWPGYQHQLDRLVQELGLERFEQHESGDMMVERSPHAPPVRMRGPQASAPRAELFKDWAVDPYTTTTSDSDGTGQHPEAPAAGTSTGPWAGRLTGIGSEWSPQFSGYVAGAIDAASRGVGALPQRRMS